jgi:hypothetical protein
MTEIGKLRKAVATIEDSEVVFTVEGFIDFSSDWRAHVHFKAMPSLDKGWLIRRDFLCDDDEIKELLREEYDAFTHKYLHEDVEIAEVDCEHDEDYVYENEAGKEQCDRCEAILN